VTAESAPDDHDDRDCEVCADRDVRESAIICNFFEQLSALEALRWQLAWMLGRRRPRCER
jgi:hypothetical protein